MQDSISINYTEAQNWGDASLGEVSITNNSDRNIINWNLKFDLSSNITNLWDAKIIESGDGHYTVENVSSNREITAGETVTFSFITNSGSATPQSFKLDTLEFPIVDISDRTYTFKHEILAPNLSLEKTQTKLTTYGTANPTERKDNSGYYSSQGLLVTDIFGQEVISNDIDEIKNSNADIVTNKNFNICLNWFKTARGRIAQSLCFQLVFGAKESLLAKQSLLTLNKK